jgi:hypothetical protein
MLVEVMVVTMVEEVEVQVLLVLMGSVVHWSGSFGGNGVASSITGFICYKSWWWRRYFL